MKKMFYGLLLGTAMFALAACGNGGGAAPAPQAEGGAAAPPAQAAAEAAAPEATDEVTTITWTTWEGGLALETFDRMIERFEAENPDIRIDHINMPDEYDTRLAAMIAAGQIPEIAKLESATLLFPLAEEGYLANILELIYNCPVQDFPLESLMPAARFMYDDDTMIGYGPGPQVMIMYFNPRLFDEAGIPHPPANWDQAWDWDTFVHHAKSLTIDEQGNNAHDPDFDPNNIRQFGINMGQWWANWGGFVISAGSDYLSADGMRLGLLEPGGIQALQNFVDLIHVHHVHPTPEFQGALPGMAERFITGRVAMEIGGHWNNMGLMMGGVDYQLAALPRIGDRSRTKLVTGSLSIFDTPHNDLAWRFFKFILTPEPDEMDLQTSGLWTPSTVDLLQPQYLYRWLTPNHPPGYEEVVIRALLDDTAVQTFTGRVRNFSRIQDIVSPALDLAWAGDMTVEEALQDVIHHIDPLIEGWR